MCSGLCKNNAVCNQIQKHGAKTASRAIWGQEIIKGGERDRDVKTEKRGERMTDRWEEATLEVKPINSW